MAVATKTSFFAKCVCFSGGVDLFQQRANRYIKALTRTGPMNLGRRRPMRASLCLAALLFGFHAAEAAENLVQGGDFEQGFSGWHSFWSRDAAGQAVLDQKIKHGGRQAVRIEHHGKQDWSFAQQRWLKVEPGQIYELAGWVRVQGEGTATLSVILRDAEQKVTNWNFAGRTAWETKDWRELRCRFVIPPGTAAMQARLLGTGPATVWFDDASLALVGTLDALRNPKLPKQIALSNANLDVVFHSGEATFLVTDRRTNATWRQRTDGGSLVVTDAKKTDAGLALGLIDPASMLQIAVDVRLEPDRPELVFELRAAGELSGVVEFPKFFASQKGTLLILPVNEGISYPVDDDTLQPMHYHLYGGHGLCMPWYGLTNGRRGVMALVETPNDAAVRIPRLDGLLQFVPQWVPEKGQFGPSRRIRYVFFDAGGYVAMAKRYREYSKATGLFKTLAEKREKNPNVDLLVGAVNIWCWDRNPVEIVRELQTAGIKRILWSNQADPESLRQMNELGVLTSRYDIYQDLMDPAVFPKLHGVHPDWTTEGWPKDIILGPDGKWIRGWGVQGKGGEWYYCAVLCDRQAIAYARKRIPPELKTHPYRCRFIDTTTAAPWHECYSLDHPMTRTESRKFKMDLLRFVSEECGLVTGSETGHDAAVPVVHYFEGMLSLGPYRVPDAGRNMAQVLDEVPERVAKFQTGHYYRLPLWELVYHDCVVAQWYWGDYNNKLPRLWDRRDLWNALYGTPPMFMFNRQQWQKHRERFVKSYQTATSVARATGYSEMLSHRWLTDDHAVQETRFANGVTVTVNFGDQPYTLPDNTTLPPLGWKTTGVD